MNRLANFAFGALRLLPTSLWWVLALLVGVVASLEFEKELWPHTPGAVVVARWVGIGCLLGLPVLGALWVWRIASYVAHPGWRFLWQMAAGGTSVLVGCLLLLVLFIVVFR